MNISKKTCCGLRILLHLASLHGNGKTMKGKAIAEMEGITEAYLEQLMVPLRQSGMVSTQRGPRGGYFLDKAPKEISLLDIIELFEGKMQLYRCRQGIDGCPWIRTCQASGTWHELYSGIIKFAKETTLGKILKAACTAI